MDDLDGALARLASDRVPDRLSSIDGLVLRRVAGHSFACDDHPIGFRVAAVAAALFMGVAAGMLPAERASGEGALAPFGGAAELAPSSLLTTRW